LHLDGILFPHINDEARSKSHQIYIDYFKNVKHIAVLLAVTKGRFTQTRTCVPVAYACVTHGLFDNTNKYKQQTLYKNEIYFVSNDILMQLLHVFRVN